MVPDHTRGAHPTASGRLQTVVLFRQSYPALTNGGVVNAVVPCGTWRQLSCNLGSRLQRFEILRCGNSSSPSRNSWPPRDLERGRQLFKQDRLKTFAL